MDLSDNAGAGFMRATEQASATDTNKDLGVG